MELTSILLQIIASAAIAIAGFSGVVVALTGKSTESFNQLEKLNLRILLQVSAFALFFTMVPLVLSRALETDIAWQISMLIYGGVHLLDSGYFILKSKKSETKSKIQTLAPIAGAFIAIYQIMAGLFGSNTLIEVSYLFVLIWHLAIAGMGFANLLFTTQNKKQSRSESPADTEESKN